MSAVKDIADALSLAEHFADGEKVCVILDDNIIEGSIRGAVEGAEISGNRIVSIEEKRAKWTSARN